MNSLQPDAVKRIIQKPSKWNPVEMEWVYSSLLKTLWTKEISKTIKLLLKIYSLWTKLNQWQWIYPDNDLILKTKILLEKLSWKEQETLAQKFYDKTIWKDPSKNWITYIVTWLFKNTTFESKFWELENKRLGKTWEIEWESRVTPKGN